MDILVDNVFNLSIIVRYHPLNVIMTLLPLLGQSRSFPVLGALRYHDEILYVKISNTIDTLNKRHTFCMGFFLCLENAQSLDLVRDQYRTEFSDDQHTDSLN